MLQHLRANLWLLVLSVIVCVALYPLALFGIGQTLFRGKAEGSLLRDKTGAVVGSRLIAQPFTADEYFWPRPSAASYNGATSGASNWGASNYLLRERVARALGPIVKYRSGPKKGQLVGPDVEAWFQKDQFAGKPGVVAQWAESHNAVAQNWVKADKLNADYVTRWQKEHAAEVAHWKKENPDTPEPKPEDLAVVFFKSYSKAFSGAFPVAAEQKTPAGKAEKRIESAKAGQDIQGIFFDMWRQENPHAELEDVPADMVMASGSGLDPHITLKNALYQLDRVAGKWAERSKLDPAKTRKEIDDLLRAHSEAPLGGLAGVGLVNVLEVNLALRDRYAPLGQP
jgi:K+-transporting ATPase ATPase C chain